MRPFIALVAAAGILGSVQAYMSFQKAASTPATAPAAPQQQASNYQVRFTPSFDAAPDPFQLYPASIEIRRLGADEALMRFADAVAAGTSHRADVYLPLGISQLVVEARLPEDGDKQPLVNPEQPVHIDLEFFPANSDAEDPVLATTVTLRPEWRRLVGEVEVELP